MTLRATLIQHAVVKRLSWHPINADLLLIQTSQPEAILYLWNAVKDEPRVVSFPSLRFASKAEAQWVPGQDIASPMIMFGDAHGYAFAWTEGKLKLSEGSSNHEGDVSVTSEPGSEDDSLYAILSGGNKAGVNSEETPMPTEADLDTVANGIVEDTFHFRKGIGAH